MAITIPHFLHPLPLLSFPSFPLHKTSIRCCSSSSSSASPLMESHNESKSKFMEFPYVSAPHKNLMVQLVSSVETRLGSSLLPSTLPPDVQSFQNPNGTAHATLHVRSGNQSSLVDFILGSWVHCKLPSGGELNITSLSAYLKPLTDAPNFIIELIRSSPTSLVLILDLPPRKDLVLNPDYLKTFYEETQLDKHRQVLEKLPEVKPYYSSVLYIRALVSPTAIVFRIEAEDGEVERMEDIIRDHLSPISKEIMELWLDMCACVDREVGDDERACLTKRDRVFKNMTVEIDLGSSFPRLFGEDVATRVLTLLKGFYNS